VHSYEYEIQFLQRKEELKWLEVTNVLPRDFIYQHPAKVFFWRDKLFTRRAFASDTRKNKQYDLRSQ